MAKSTLFALLVCMLLSGLACQDTSLGERLDGMTSGGPVQHGDVVQLAGTTLDGVAWSTRDAAGRPVLINFWATWCGPCIEEIPSLLALRASFAPGDITLVGVTIDQEQPAVLQDFVARLGMDYIVLHDADERLARGLGWSKGIPKTLLVDGQGRLATFWWGKTDFMEPGVREVIAGAVAKANFEL